MKTRIAQRSVKVNNGIDQIIMVPHYYSTFQTSLKAACTFKVLSQEVLASLSLLIDDTVLFFFLLFCLFSKGKWATSGNKVQSLRKLLKVSSQNFVS